MSLEKAIEKFVECVEAFTTYILVVHPEDIDKVDLDEFPENVYFVETYWTERGQVISIKDEELRKEFLRSIKSGEMKYRRGKKEV